MVGKFSTIEPCLPLKGSISQTGTFRIKFAMHELEGSHLNHMRHPNVEEPGQSQGVCSLFLCLGTATQCFLVSFLVDMTKYLAQAT